MCMAEARRLEQKELTGTSDFPPVPKLKTCSETVLLDRGYKVSISLACGFGFGRNSGEPVFGDVLDIHTTEPVHPSNVTKVEGNSLFSAF